MNPGRLHKRILIQTRTVTEDTQWDDVTTWTDHVQRWAEVTPISAKERMRNQGPSSEATYTMTLRWEDNLLSDQDRIVWDSRTFDIVGIINVDERDVEMNVLLKVWDQS